MCLHVSCIYGCGVCIAAALWQARVHIEEFVGPVCARARLNAQRNIQKDVLQANYTFFGEVKIQGFFSLCHWPWFPPLVCVILQPEWKQESQLHYGGKVLGRGFPQGSCWEGRNWERSPDLLTINNCWHSLSIALWARNCHLFVLHSRLGLWKAHSAEHMFVEWKSEWAPPLGGRTALPLSEMPFLMVLTWPAPSCHLLIYF